MKTKIVFVLLIIMMSLIALLIFPTSEKTSALIIGADILSIVILIPLYKLSSKKDNKHKS